MGSRRPTFATETASGSEPLPAASRRFESEPTTKAMMARQSGDSTTPATAASRHLHLRRSAAQVQVCAPAARPTTCSRTTLRQAQGRFWAAHTSPPTAAVRNWASCCTSPGARHASARARPRLLRMALHRTAGRLPKAYNRAVLLQREIP